MSLIDLYTAQSRRQARLPELGRTTTRTFSALRMLLAGMHASKEYRHLNGMTDQQLASLGLSRGGIEQEVRRRHLAQLGGRFARGD